MKDEMPADRLISGLESWTEVVKLDPAAPWTEPTPTTSAEWTSVAPPTAWTARDWSLIPPELRLNKDVTSPVVLTMCRSPDPSAVMTGPPQPAVSCEIPMTSPVWTASAGASETVTSPSAAAKGPRSPRNARFPAPGWKSLILNPFVQEPPCQYTVADVRLPSPLAP